MASEIRHDTTELELYDPTSYLEGDVWELIFKKLDSYPETLQSCYFTCFTFQDVLERWRNDFRIEKSFPLLANYLKPSEALLCRLLSKSWKFLVDSFFESPRFHQFTREPLSTKELRWKHWIENRCEIFSQEIPSEELEAIRETLPVTGGHLTLGILKGVIDSIGDSPEPFWTGVAKLIPQLAARVKHVSIRHSEISVEEAVYDLIFNTIVPQFENLVSIHVAGGSDPTFWFSPDNMFTLWTLPNLVELKTSWIPLYGSNDLWTSFGESPLKTLILEKPSMAFIGWRDGGYYFPKLEILVLDTDSENMFIRVSQDILRANEQLRELTVCLHTFTKFEVFKWLRLRQSQLRSLHLQFSGKVVLDKCMSRRRRPFLPNLEELSITVKKGLKILSLDFVLNLKSLKSLKVTQESWEFESMEKIPESYINLRGYVTRMEHSNIWFRLPNLERLELCESKTGKSWRYRRDKVTLTDFQLLARLIRTYHKERKVLQGSYLLDNKLKVTDRFSVLDKCKEILKPLRLGGGRIIGRKTRESLEKLLKIMESVKVSDSADFLKKHALLNRLESQIANSNV